MLLSLIVAASENNVIGKRNALPWYLPDDLKHFKKITGSSPIIMGRKTYESIGRPLPNRRNIVLSTTLPKDALPGCEIFANIEIAFATLVDQEVPEAFIIGGEQLFRSVLEHEVLGLSLDRIYLTRVHADIEGDIVLPPIDWNEWKEVSREDHAADEKHPFAFSFLLFERIK